MALIIHDGLGGYAGEDGDDIHLEVAKHWTGFNYSETGVNISRTLAPFAGGSSIYCSGGYGGYFFETLDGSTDTYWFGARVYFDSTLHAVPAGYGLCGAFYDGGTAQVSFRFETNGDITFFSGDQGAVLATYTSGLVAAFSWNLYRIKIVISSSSGEIHVRRDGSAVDDFSVTGLNTAPSGKNKATQFRFVPSNGTRFTPYSEPFHCTDIRLWDKNGSVDNDWLGNYRTVYLSPISDSEVSFTQAQNQLVYGSTTKTNGLPGLSSGKIYTVGTLVGRPGVLNSVSLNFTTAPAGNYKIGLYSTTSSGIPGDLLAVSGEINSPTVGIDIAFSFLSHPTIVLGGKYFVAILSDVSGFGLYGASNTTTQYYFTNSYSSGFPNPFANVNVSTMTYGTVYMLATMASPVGNFSFVCDYKEDGDISYISANSVNAQDMYNVSSMPYIPVSIYGVQVRVLGKVSVSGDERTIAALLSSGNSSIRGDAEILATSYYYSEVHAAVSPATGLPFTADELSEIKVGMIRLE